MLRCTEMRSFLARRVLTTNGDAFGAGVEDIGVLIDAGAGRIRPAKGSPGEDESFRGGAEVLLTLS